MTRPIDFSLPGIARADRTTVSSGPTLTWRWSSMAIRRHRLALRPGGQTQHVLGGVAADFRVADLQAGRNAQVSEALGDLGVLNHAASDKGDAAIELRRQIDEDLHPVDARRERRDDQLAAGAGEDFLEGFHDLELGAGEAAAIDVGAVGEQRQHAGGAELGEPVDVEVLAVNRRLVDLEVAGVDDDPRRGVNRDCHAIRHAVRDAYELDLERAHGDALARRYRYEHAAIEAVLLQLRLDQRQRQRRAVDRAGDERRDVGHPADVIFVPVRQDQRRGTALLLQIGEIRNDAVDAEQFGIGKHHTRIDDERGRSPGQREHVHSELAESA
jgi:hypothetical protein